MVPACTGPYGDVNWSRTGGYVPALCGMGFRSNRMRQYYESPVEPL